MLKVKRFINELMTSNCYLLYEDETIRAIAVDPGSEKMLDAIAFIEDHHLVLDYIILTHEHTDHTWGVNALMREYGAKIICSAACKKALPKECQAYFSFYYDNPKYEYKIERIDYTTEELNNQLTWDGNAITFINTPGHSIGSICISIENMLFSGDTIMQYKPYINKKRGSYKEYLESVERIVSLYDENTMVYPGHGELFHLKGLSNINTEEQCLSII